MPSAAPSLLGVPAAVRPRADHFLQRDDVGVDGAQHGGDAIGTRAAVEAAAAVDVVGGDAQRGRAAVTHYAMIVRASRVVVAGVRVVALSRRSSRVRAEPPTEPLKLDGNLLTVDNRSNQDWTQRRDLAEPELPRHDSVAARRRRASGAARCFVAGFGQRFDLQADADHAICG